MKTSMKGKLEALVKRIDVLNTELSHEDVTKDIERYKKISKEHSDITPIVEIYKKYQKITLDIEEAKELPIPPDPEVTRMEFDMKDKMIRQTIMDTKQDVDEMKKTLERIENKLYNR